MNSKSTTILIFIIFLLFNSGITHANDLTLSHNLHVGIYFGMNYTSGNFWLNYNALDVKNNNPLNVIIPAGKIRSIQVSPKIELSIYKLNVYQKTNVSSITLTNDKPIFRISRSIPVFDFKSVGFSFNDSLAFSISGSDCEDSCSDNSICNPITSKCECIGNFEGFNCGKCKKGFYGNNCENKCHCSDKFGLGCDDGVKGSGSCKCDVGDNNIGYDCQECKVGFGNTGKVKCNILNNKKICEPICKPNGNSCNGIASLADDFEHCAVPYGYRVDQNTRIGEKNMCEEGFYYNDNTKQCTICGRYCRKCEDITGNCLECHKSAIPTFPMNDIKIEGKDCILPREPKRTELSPLCSVYNVRDYKCQECLDSGLCISDHYKPKMDCEGQKAPCFDIIPYAHVKTGWPVEEAQNDTFTLLTKINPLTYSSSDYLLTYRNQFGKGKDVGILNKKENTIDVCPNMCKTCKVTSQNYSKEQTIFDVNVECTSCMHEYIMVDNKCVRADEVDKCKSNEYMDYEIDLDTFTDISHQCRECDKSCLSCINASSDKCTSCRPGSDLVNGKCITKSCMDVKFPFLVGNECHGCDRSCKTCNGPNINNCTSCPEGTVLVDDGICSSKCPPGSRKGLNILGTTCVSCPNNCAYCNDIGICIVCENGLTGDYCEKNIVL